MTKILCAVAILLVSGFTFAENKTFFIETVDGTDKAMDGADCVLIIDKNERMEVTSNAMIALPENAKFVDVRCQRIYGDINSGAWTARAQVSAGDRTVLKLFLDFQKHPVKTFLK